VDVLPSAWTWAKPAPRTWRIAVVRMGLWAVADSNSRPPACKAGALPAELTARTVEGNACRLQLSGLRADQGLVNVGSPALQQPQERPLSPAQLVAAALAAVLVPIVGLVVGMVWTSWGGRRAMPGLVVTLGSLVVAIAILSVAVGGSGS
jgi:ribose/xylose/arabinose/galactoside ABC-type transport system permease subunit